MFKFIIASSSSKGKARVKRSNTVRVTKTVKAFKKIDELNPTSPKSAIVDVEAKSDLDIVDKESKPVTKVLKAAKSAKSKAGKIAKDAKAAAEVVETEVKKSWFSSLFKSDLEKATLKAEKSRLEAEKAKADIEAKAAKAEAAFEAAKAKVEAKLKAKADKEAEKAAEKVAKAEEKLKAKADKEAEKAAKKAAKAAKKAEQDEEPEDDEDDEEEEGEEEEVEEEPEEGAEAVEPKEGETEIKEPEVKVSKEEPEPKESKPAKKVKAIKVNPDSDSKDALAELKSNVKSKNEKPVERKSFLGFKLKRKASKPKLLIDESSNEIINPVKAVETSDVKIAFAPEELFKVLKVKLSKADINALSTTPFELIPSPGPGKAVILNSVLLNLIPGGTPFTNTNSPGIINLKYDNDINGVLNALGNCIPKTFYDNISWNTWVSDTYKCFHHTVNYTNDILNKNITISNIGEPIIGGDDNSALYIHLTYRVFDLC